MAQKKLYIWSETINKTWRNWAAVDQKVGLIHWIKNPLFWVSSVWRVPTAASVLLVVTQFAQPSEIINLKHSVTVAANRKSQVCSKMQRHSAALQQRRHRISLTDMFPVLRDWNRSYHWCCGQFEATAKNWKLQWETSGRKLSDPQVN